MKFMSIFVGYQNCRVFDDFNDRNCSKCCGYGHSLKKCPRKEERLNICSKCATTHEEPTCNTNTLTCNCVKANKYLKKKRDEHHDAKDKSCCETYRARWEKYISMTNYPWRPDLPFKNATTGNST